MTKLDPQLAIDAFPVTAAQEHALALATADAALRIRWELRGPVQDHEVTAALNAVIARHEILRTRFARRDGTWRQDALPSAALMLGHVDIRALPIDDHADRVEAIGAELAAARFDLQSPPLLRASLVRTAPRRAVLLVAVHRAVMDDPSAELFGQELLTLLRVGPPGPGNASVSAGAALPELALQYGDFALWERDCRASSAAAQDRVWWQRRLEGLHPVVLSERARPAGERIEIAQVVVPLPPRFQARYCTASERLGVSPQALGAAAASAAVARLAAPLAQADAPGLDVVLGTVSDGRFAPELGPLVGAFGQRWLIPLELSLHTDLAEHLFATAQALTQAGAHPSCPLPDLSGDAEGADTPLPETTLWFTLQDFGHAGPEGGALHLSAPHLHGGSPERGLALHLSLSAQCSSLTLIDETGRLSQDTLAGCGSAFLAALDTLVDGAAGRVGELPGASPEVAARLQPTQPSVRPSAPAPSLRKTEDAQARPTWEIVLLRDGPDDGPVVVTISQPFLYRNFATCFAGDRTVVNLTVPDLPSLSRQREGSYLAAMNEGAECLAQRFAERPVVLMGQCIDGMNALHIARRLEECGGEVACVAMIDSWAPMHVGTGDPTFGDKVLAWDQGRRRWQHYLGLAARGRLGPRDLMLRSGAGRRLLRRLGRAPADAAGAELIIAVNEHHTETGHRTPFPGWDGDVVTFASDSQRRSAFDTLFGWRGLVPADTPIHRVPGWHEDALLDRSYMRMAEVIDTRLSRYLKVRRA
ncbi:MAG: condensation domain-containing protein [Pseudomonadota bacterium]